MRAAIFAYSRRGCITARRVAACLRDADVSLFAPGRFDEPGFAPIPQPSEVFYAECFAWADALIFVGACGVAVRIMAPHIRDKRTDPAAIVIDELCTCAISVLSGHIGGANALARELARALGAQPIITTATDLNRRFSPDAWAARHGFAIGDMKAAKAVSAVILEGDVPLVCELPVCTELPTGVYYGREGAVGIVIGYHRDRPFETTLNLIPRILHVGVGCRRGASREKIDAAITTVFDAHDLDLRAVRDIASIDLKAAEAGLRECAGRRGWPLHYYPAEALLSVRGDFGASEFVRSVTGVDNVCERAARMNACTTVVKKTAVDGVTIAVAAEYAEVGFE